MEVCRSETFLKACDRWDVVEIGQPAYETPYPRFSSREPASETVVVRGRLPLGQSVGECATSYLPSL
ncbi:hypothetical protein FHS27_002173 [Rhodopirellula rubra]|uniref:Uncharacterized protein n=1 Tax=Aporhodopirellula rubra TaxID=980271 RepID=A0A7W5H5F0_9BACT|nr:hypothetical protein [Aporhodopirellula rubra]